jgi:hypothetical protein
LSGDAGVSMVRLHDFRSRTMRTSVAGLAALLLVQAHPACAAEYNCATKETGIKLNDYDIGIAKREAAIADMREEIKSGGGSTEQQKKALESYEAKLAKVKSEREALLKDCSAKTAP